MCKELKVRQLPKGTKIRDEFTGYYGGDFNRSVFAEVVSNDSYHVLDEVANLNYDVRTVVKAKLRML